MTKAVSLQKSTLIYDSEISTNQANLYDREQYKLNGAPTRPMIFTKHLTTFDWSGCTVDMGLVMHTKPISCHNFCAFILNRCHGSTGLGDKIVI